MTSWSSCHYKPSFSSCCFLLLLLFVVFLETRHPTVYNYVTAGAKIPGEDQKYQLLCSLHIVPILCVGGELIAITNFMGTSIIVVIVSAGPFVSFYVKPNAVFGSNI